MSLECVDEVLGDEFTRTLVFELERRAAIAELLTAELQIAAASLVVLGERRMGLVEDARAYARLKTIPNTLYLVDAEKAEIACYLGLLPGARPVVDSLLDQIILAGEEVDESRKMFARELRAEIEKR